MNVFMDIKKNLRTVARNAAFRVEFLTSGREILFVHECYLLCYDVGGGLSASKRKKKKLT